MADFLRRVKLFGFIYITSALLTPGKDWVKWYTNDGTLEAKS